MNARTLLSLSLAASLAASPLAAGEASWPPLTGDRVRLSAEPLSAGPVVAEVLEVGSEEVMLRIPPLAAPVRVRVDQISRLEVSRGKHSQVGKGALVGAGGVAVFLVSLVALFCDGDCWDDETGEIIGKSALAGGIAGAAVGAAFTREEWVPVVPTRPRLGPGAAGSQPRPQFAVSFRF